MSMRERTPGRPAHRRRSAAAVLCTLLMIGATSSASADDVPFPDAKGGERLAAFVAAFNSNDTDALTEFIETHYVQGGRTTEERLASFQHLYGQFGAIDLVRIEEMSDLRCGGLFKLREPHGDEEWVTMTVMLDSLPPQRIGGIMIQNASAPLDLPDRMLRDDEIVSEIRTFVDERTAADRFSGTVLLARGNDVLFRGAWGLASRRFQVPINVETKINLGSMNKMFTAVAIGQLVDQGKMTFNDRLIDLVPDYPNPEIAGKITVHHLLTHTSGTGDYWTDEFEEKWFKVRRLDDYLPFIAPVPLEFEPGEQMRYSNSGFVILGMIVEAVSGEDYFDYVREHIYEPAGMTNSDCYHIENPVPNLAIGYTRMMFGGERSPDRWRNNLYLHTTQGGPAGGGFSTVDDLHRFAMALADDKLLSCATRDLLWEGKQAMGPNLQYAYGFSDNRENGHRTIGHNGGGPGISAEFRYLPDLDYTIAVLSNIDDAAHSVSDMMRELIVHQRPAPMVVDH